MATRNSDGSIILDVEVDPEGLETGMEKIKKGGKSIQNSFGGILNTVSNLAGAIVAAFSVSAIIDFSKESSALAAQTESSVKRLIALYGEASDVVGDFIDANARSFGMSKNAAASYAATYGNLFSSWSDQATNAKLTNEFLRATAVIANKTGRTVEDVQNRIRSGLLGSTEAIEDLGVYTKVSSIEMTEAFKKIANGKSWAQLDTHTQQQITAYAILEQSVEKYGNELDETFLLSQERVKAAYEEFQNTWGTILNEVLVPVLNIATQILDVFTETLSKIGKVSSGILGNQQATAAATGDTAKNQAKITDETKKTAKEQKRSVAGFDTIQRLSAETAENTATTSSNTANDYMNDFLNSAVAQSDGGESLKNDISIALAAATAVIGGFMVALGVVLVCTGVGVGLGLSLIVLGLASEVVSVGVTWNYLENKLHDSLQALAATIGVFMLVIGVICLLSGNILGMQIGLSLILGSLAVGMIVPNWDFLSDKVREIFEKIKTFWTTQVQPFIDEIVKIIKDFVENKILPIWNDKIKPQLDELKKNLSDLWNKVILPILTWIGEKFKILWGKFLSPIVQKIKDIFLKTLSAGLNFLGEVFEFIGDRIEDALSILNGLIEFVVGAFTGDWETAWDGISKVFETLLGSNGLAFTEWLQSLIDAIQNGDWEAAWDAVKTALSAMVNSCIGLFEKLLNKIIDGINGLIPDSKSALGQFGSMLGFDISKVQMNHITIPRLAQGAVIPANREFLAVLGDQKSGTNIETPLKTMIEAFTTALDSRGGTDITINFTGSEAQFIRALSPKIEINNKYHGKNLLTGKQV